MASTSLDPPLPLDVTVLGDRAWRSGSRVALRVVVRDLAAAGAAGSAPPPAGGVGGGVGGSDLARPLVADLSISLVPAAPADAARDHRLWEGRTSRLGTADLSLRLPEVGPGRYRLRVTAVTALGSDRVERDIDVVDGSLLALGSDRDVYHPGETVHLRGLALRRPGLRPAAGLDLPVTLLDPRGNLVHRKSHKVSPLGLLEVDFPISPGALPGWYRVRATLPSGTFERALEVREPERFRVGVATDREVYLPGDTLEGSVRVASFEQLPLAGSRVEVRVLGPSGQRLSAAYGVTDRAGSLRFSFSLPALGLAPPETTAGPGAPGATASSSSSGLRPLSLAIEAEVSDAAERRQVARTEVEVLPAPLRLRVAAEGGGLSAGVPNRVFILATAASGRPEAGVEVAASLGGDIHRATTDALGLVELEVEPAATPLTVEVEARDAAGSTASVRADLPARRGSAQGLRLTLDHVLASGGDRIEAALVGQPPTGTVYLDLVAAGQTALSKAVALKDGKATAQLTLTPDLEGLIEVRAYRSLPGAGEIAADSRFVYVPPAAALVPSLEPGSSSQRPGETARLGLQVRDGNGLPAPSLVLVALRPEGAAGAGPEAALRLGAELGAGTDPRLAAECARWLLDPAAPIPGPLPEKAARAARDRLARVFLALAAPQPSPFTLHASSHADRLERAKRDWQRAIDRDAARIQRALLRYYGGSGGERRPLAEKTALRQLARLQLLVPREVMDPWGRLYRARLQRQALLSLASAGPDGEFGTGDDTALEVAVMPASLIPPPSAAAPGPPAGSPAIPGEAVATGLAPVPAIGLGPGWRAAVVTGEDGRAAVSVRVPEEPGRHRLAVVALDRDGRLGLAAFELTSRRDLTVHLDAPARLTAGDEVTLPLTVASEPGGPGSGRLELKLTGGLERLERAAPPELALAPGGVTGLRVRLAARSAGSASLTATVTAEGSRETSERRVEVVADADRLAEVRSGALDGERTETLELPRPAAGNPGLQLEIEAGTLAVTRAAAEGLWRREGRGLSGRIAATAAQALLLADLERSPRFDPGLRHETETRVSSGYQELLARELPGGGFSDAGTPPADPVVTAQALIALGSIAGVQVVDDQAIARSRKALLARARPDGSFEPSAGAPAGATPTAQPPGAPGSSRFATTAWSVWALGESALASPEHEKGTDWLRRALAEDPDRDPRALALAIHALSTASSGGGDRALVAALAERLVAHGEGPGDEAASRGARLETSALRAWALLRAGSAAEPARRAVGALLAARSGERDWPTGLATIAALRALHLARPPGRDPAAGRVQVRVNGTDATPVELTAAEAGEAKRVDLGPWAKAGTNRIELRPEALTPAGGGSAMSYRIQAEAQVPWDRVSLPADAPLALTVDYAERELGLGETLLLRASVEARRGRPVDEATIEIGLPPGVDVDPSPLDTLVASRSIRSYAIEERRVWLWAPGLPANAPLRVELALHPRYPMRARTLASRAYPSAEPEAAAVVKPVVIRVK